MAGPRSGEFGEGRFWFSRSGSTVTLGITNAAAEELGEAIAVELPSDGDDFNRGEAVAMINSKTGSLELTSPASGLVTEVNVALQEHPERVTDDPQEEGWIVRLDIQDSSELEEAQDD